MFSEAWSRVLTASVAPVVVISASGLLCLAFYNRLAAIVARLRGLQRERIAELERIHAAGDADSDATALHRRVLRGLEVQTAQVVVRARLIRLTLLCLLSAIALIILSSIFHGMTVVWPGAAVPAAVVFIMGMAGLLGAAITAIAELVRSLDVVEFECDSVTALTLEHGVDALDGEAAHNAVATGART